MGNQCDKTTNIQREPYIVFKSIVTVQKLIRGYMARRNLRLLKQYKELINHERMLLKKSSLVLDSILYPQLLKKGVKILELDKENMGCFYVGQVVDGLPNGFGRKVNSRNKYWEGEFDNGIFRKGKFYNFGTTQQGYFKNGKLEGRGIEIKSDGTQYEGAFIQGIPDGFGKKTDSKGNYYEGQFKNGLLNGDGEFQGIDGRYYQGQWINDLYDGKGLYVFPSGQRYSGDFKLGKRHGYGEYTYNGNGYFGEWKDGFRHGEGYMLVEGQMKQGIWQNGNQIK